MIHPDRIAEYDFSNEDTLILGGTRGFGLALGMDLKRKGVKNLALGTSGLRSGHYQNALGAFIGAGVDIEGVVHFAAQMTDLEQVQQAIDRLSFEPRHVFALPATGMQFAREFHPYVAKLQSIKSHPERYDCGARDQTLFELHRKYDVWLPQHLRDALIMNVDAPVQMVEALIRSFPEGFTLNYLDSLLADEGRGPRFYTDVLTKHMFASIWLPQNARSYARRGVDVSNIKTSAILGTDIGDYLVDEVAPIENKEAGEMLIDTAVEPDDVFKPFYQFMAMSRDERILEGLPFGRYVYRHNGELFITETFPNELRVDPDKYLL